jgi:hypothetical protein
MSEQEPSLSRHSLRSTCWQVLRFLKRPAAQIDLPHFPGSCCG